MNQNGQSSTPPQNPSTAIKIGGIIAMLILLFVPTLFIWLGFYWMDILERGDFWGVYAIILGYRWYGVIDRAGN
jgi:hypothetical protein